MSFSGFSLFLNNNRSIQKENLSRKSRTNLLHKESTKTAAFLNKIGVESKSRLISNTSGSFSNSTTDFRLDQLDKTDLKHECQYITIISFEIFCHTNEIYAYSIDKDEICGIFCTIASETIDGWKIQSSIILSTNYLHLKNLNLLKKSFQIIRK